jgi:hypothetical protein
MEVKELHDLFSDFEVPVLDQLSFPSDYHPIPIPICQHNIYKYSPFHITSEPSSQDGLNKFRIIFPEARLSHFTHLYNVNLGEIEKASVPVTPRTKEDRLHESLLQAVFTPDESFTIDALMAQMYLSYVNQYNLETWYPLLKQVEEREGERESKHPLFPATEFIELLPHEIVNMESIYDKTSQGRYLGQASKEIREMAKELEPRLQVALSRLHGQAKNGKQKSEKGSDKGDETLNSPFFFFKLNTRSPKDSVFYKDKSVFASIDKSNASYQLKKCQATNAHEVVSALVSSARVHADCQSFREWRVKPEAKPPLLLVLQEWRTFLPHMEFRCFVFERQLTAVGQLCWETHIEELEDREFKERVLVSIEKLFEFVKDVLPWENCIMDVIYDQENNFSQICEFNPWGPYSCTGSQIHNWELDEHILFGEKHKSENRTRPYFRTLKKGMLVVDHFDLYVPKVMCEFSPTFHEKLGTIEGHACSGSL